MNKQDLVSYLIQIENKLQGYHNPKYQKDINQLKSYIHLNDIDESKLDFIYQLLKLLDEAISASHKEIIKCKRKETDIYKSITIKTYIIGLGKQFYRIMELPYDITLADLACFVLASFKANGTHLFSVKYNKKIYSDKDNLATYGASQVHLCDLELVAKSQLEIEYDYGDCWNFKVTIQSINNHDDIFDLADSRIMKGKGYGIWEDEHSLMYLYYRGYALFLEAIKDNDMDVQDFKDREFNIVEANHKLLGHYNYIKNMYK